MAREDAHLRLVVRQGQGDLAAGLHGQQALRIESQTRVQLELCREHRRDGGHQLSERERTTEAGADGACMGLSWGWQRGCAFVFF
jgi:hypothetical protein